MKPSLRMDYALKALVDLALHPGTGPLTVASIAKRQGIPAHCLEQVFNRLRRTGLVVAERGPRGGYQLSRPPSEIMVNEIFQSLEPSGVFQHNGGLTRDPTTTVWKQVERAVRTTLEATTLEALAAQVRDQIPSGVNPPFTFHI